MSLAYTIYRLVGTGLYLFLAPAGRAYCRVSGSDCRSIKQRLGDYSRQIAGATSSASRIWMHAASVGEVGVAESIVNALLPAVPGIRIILTTITKQGHVYAQRRLAGRAVCLYAPIDLPPAPVKALNALKPDILVFLETEIWPNLLTAAARRRIPTAIVNGRISSRSIHRYIKIRPLIRTALSGIDVFSMISSKDAERIQRLGAPSERICINGNAKYDSLASQARPALQQKVASQLNAGSNRPVWVAGSTREGEEETILDVYRRIRRGQPNLVLVIAPRHISRVPKLEGMMAHKGFASRRWTAFRTPNGKTTDSADAIVIVDTIGDLKGIYSISSLVFCGGSLVPLGGQNPLEAAVWGKPVLYGPSMDDFLEAKQLLETAGGGLQVQDGEGLYNAVRFLLETPSQAEEMGRNARLAVLSNTGAAEKHAAVIRRLLNRPHDRGNAADTFL